MRFFKTKASTRHLAVLGVFLLFVAACAPRKEGGRTEGGRTVSAAAAIKPKSWKITVGPHPCSLTDDDNSNLQASTQVVQRGKPGVTWRTDKKEKLYIVFHLDPDGTCPPPFVEQLFDLGIQDEQSSELYLLRDDGNGNITVNVSATACACGLPNPSDCDTPNLDGQGKWQIKYDQYIVSAKGSVVISCDGMIIIKP
jgi:hypothetical protein